MIYEQHSHAHIMVELCHLPTVCITCMHAWWNAHMQFFNNFVTSWMGRWSNGLQQHSRREWKCQFDCNTASKHGGDIGITYNSSLVGTKYRHPSHK